MRSHIILGLCCGLLLASSLSANTRFTGAVDELWSNPDNWNDGLPGPADKVQVGNKGFCVLDYDAGTVKHIALEGGGTGHLRLIDGAELAVSNWSIIGYAGAPEKPHFLEVLGGVYNANARMFIGFRGSGKLVVDYAGVVNLNAQEFAIGENTDGQGVVEIRGGSLNLLSTSGLPLRFRAGANSSASLDFSGGVMTQAYSYARLAVVNDHIADGTITAYDGVGTVVVDTGEANDYIHVTGLHPLNPVPADSSEVVSGTIALEWTVEPGTVVDVWFADDADKIYAAHPDALLIANQAVTFVQVTVQKDTRYFWAVDTYAPGAAEPNPGPVFDFLAVPNLPEALDTVLSFTTGGAAGWFGEGSTSYEDGDAVRSGDIAHEEESWLRTTVSGAGTVSFSWKISSEMSYDFLEFYINGSLRDRISGSVDWHAMTYVLAGSGLHTLEWRYVKDLTTDEGSDCGWVAKVVWVPAS